MEHRFHTPEPVTLSVEVAGGDVTVEAAAVTETEIRVEGTDAEDVQVQHHGREITVVAPRRTGFLQRTHDLVVRAVVPEDGELSVKLASADLTQHGRLSRVRVTTASGDVRLDEVTDETVVKTGSGDVAAERLGGPASVKTGSGDVGIGALHGPTRITTGSGDVGVGTAADALAVKSGSGDVEVRQTGTDADLSTASGDIRVGRVEHGGLRASNVSGDIHLGIASGVPVWTDVTTTTGRVSSSLVGAGQPGPDQPYLELRARTVSGDVVLDQL